jgi:hypothetical protein
VVGVIDDPTRAREAVKAVAVASDAEPYAIGPDSVLAMERDRESEQNPAQRLWAAIGSLVSDQADLQQQYLDHARQGRWVVVASARDPEGADRVWTILTGYGAHHGTYFGGAAIRELL